MSALKKKWLRLTLVGIDLFLSVCFIVVTSLVCAGIELTGLYVTMVILAIILFLVTLTLLASFFSRRHRSGDPD